MAGRRWVLTTTIALSGIVMGLVNAQTLDDRPQSGAGAQGFSPRIHPLVYRQATERDQPLLVWVFFSDKGLVNLDNDLAELELTYNERSITRRQLRRTALGLFDAHDLSLNISYVADVRSTGAQLRVQSRWLNAVSAAATMDQINQIASLPFVEHIQPVRRTAASDLQERGMGAPRGSQAADHALGNFHGQTHDQLALINHVALHEQGLTGRGVIVGVLDTGFRRSHAAFNRSYKPLSVVAEWDFVDGDPETAPEVDDPITQHDHGTRVLGAIGAFLPGTIVAGAYDASFILAKVEDVQGEYLGEEDMFIAGLEFIEANGGDVATSSVVIFDYYTAEELDGMTSVMTIGFNIATANGVHCFQGAGNEAHDADPTTASLVPPGDALQVLTCGAVDLNGEIAWFSSDGPTADGRVKPEVLAGGVDIITVDSTDDTSLIAVSGTSFATPMTAAVAACLVQAHPHWTVQQMRSALTTTADEYVATGGFDPLFVRGYGVIDALGALETRPEVLGDLDGDWFVGPADLVIMLGAWGECTDCPDCSADLDGDCLVSGTDLVLLLGNWRQP